MKMTIQLNSKDVKKLIAEKYNVPVDKIKEEFYGPSQDGIYSSPGGCFFSFKVDNPHMVADINR